MKEYSSLDRLVRAGLAVTVLALEACAAAPQGEAAADRAVTARIQASLEQYPSLETPNYVTVQTVRRVVYLRGLVSTPYQKRLAGSIAAQAAEGLHIVNIIAVDNMH
jgi:osmotically-inducible protein OsmY